MDPDLSLSPIAEGFPAGWTLNGDKLGGIIVWDFFLLELEFCGPN